MPSWKKVVVSGSDATLNSLFVSNAVTASIFSGSFRGNLTGTASYVTGSVFTSNNLALSASYALTASYALNGGGGGSITIADEGTAQGTATFINFIGSGVQAVVASNTASITITGGAATGSVALHTQAVAASTWSFSHDLGNDYPVLDIWDSSGFMVTPGGVKSIDENNLEIYFDIPQTGYASAVVGGVAVSSSFATSASYALTASYVLGATANVFPYTGSAIISGSLIVTGSVFVSNSLFINSSSISLQQNLDVDTGTEVVATVNTGSYTAAFFDYYAKDGTNFRAGTVTSVWNKAGSVQYTDNSTLDIGNTAGVTMSVALNGSLAELRATVTTNNWDVKALVRTL